MKIDDSYCLIKCVPRYKIWLALFQDKYPICLISNSATIMHELIDAHDTFRTLSISHILYLGQEIYKAEISLTLGQNYVQD